MNKAYLAIIAALTASLVRKRPEKGVWYPIHINSITPPLGSMNEPLRLYKTGEKHSNGEDIYRPVGEKPKSGMYGLTGTYYVFDGYNMYACDKPYRDDYGTFDGEPSYPIYNYVIV